MKKYSALILAIALGCLVLGPVTSRGAGGADAQIPKEITKEEAAKKYPPPAGKNYPEALSSNAGPQAARFFQSPYSNKIYDCRQVHKGALILDESVNKVFIRP